MTEMGRILIGIGIFLVFIGFVLILVGRMGFPLGRLPGDFSFKGKNFAVYFPLASSILVSLILTLIFAILGRFRR